MILDEILTANKSFTEKNKGVLKEFSSKPQKQVAILTCMDTRLVDFLEPALGIKRGDAKVIKNAGNTIRPGCSEGVRSLAAAVYLLGVNEIFVIGHSECGMANVDRELLIDKMKAEGVPEEAIDAIDVIEWIGSFGDTEENVRQTAEIVRNSPYIPKRVPVHGLLFHPQSGELKVIVNGYKV